MSSFWLKLIGVVFGDNVKHRAWFYGRRDWIRRELQFRRIAILHDGAYYRLNPILIVGDLESWPFLVDFPPPETAPMDSLEKYLGRPIRGRPPSRWHIIDTDS